MARQVFSVTFRLGTWRRYVLTVGSPSNQNRHGVSCPPATPTRGPDLIRAASTGRAGGRSATGPAGSNRNAPLTRRRRRQVHTRHSGTVALVGLSIAMYDNFLPAAAQPTYGSRPRMGKRAVVYCRISLDTTGEGLGVARQEERCRELCAQRGWQVVDVVVDNSVSASTRKVRPGWRKVLDLIESRAVDIVVAWQVDRMYRSLRDLEDLVELTEATGVTLATVSGELDLSTPNGRFLARILCSAARQEVDIKSARQKAAHHQRVKGGKPWWTARPFGFERNGDHREPEASALRQAYAEVLTGQSVYAIAARWNAAGILTPKGNPWRSSNLRHVLMQERNAGVHTYRGDETGSQATWEPLVSEDIYRATVRLLSDPTRNTGGGGHRKGLLTGVVLCSRCGGRVLQGQSRANKAGERYRVYVCRKTRCITIPADWLDSYVLRQVIDRAEQWQPSDSAEQQAAEREEVQLRAEESALLARKQSLAELFIAGTVDEVALAAGNAKAEEKLAEIRDRLAELARARAGVDLADIEAVWDAVDRMDTERVRAIVETVCEFIRLLPRRKGARTPKAEDVEIKWRIPSSPPIEAPKSQAPSAGWAVAGIRPRPRLARTEVVS